MKGLKLLLLTFATLAITACSDDTTDEWHGDFGSIQVPDTRQLSQKIPAGQTAGNSEIFFSTNYNRKNEMSIFQKRNEQIFSFFASFFLLLFRPLKHQLKADFKPLKQA